MRVFMGYDANLPESVSDEQTEPKQEFVELARECDGPHRTHEPYLITCFQPNRPDCIRILVLRS